MKHRGTPTFILGAGLALLALDGGAAGQSTQWPTFANETQARLIADPAIVANDPQEKDYAWGDVDHDGDIDLVCVRKQPWDTPGRFRNVLLTNEGTAEGHAIDGVLVDRSAQYAMQSSDGSQGFLDATADRDVALVDVDCNGWLDMVTATTYGQGLPKTISHPRVYMNLGAVNGAWQGFRYEEFRTPLMPIVPNFCSVGHGDVNGDCAPDLYFTDYNNTLEDRLWINNGSGTFTDETLARLTSQMRESDFGVRAVIADLNGDGVNDVVKDRGSTNSVPPLRISMTYNDPGNEGFFNLFEVIYNGSPYHVEVGYLNGDGLLDIVIDDDGIDRYLLNQGNGPDGLADFTTFLLPQASNGSGGNIVITDVNNDGHDDVLIADVDVDCCGCTRHMHCWRNQGNGPNVTFVEETGDIPQVARTGTFDVAVFDINGDGWKDMVIGTCTGTSIWIAQPGLAFVYPQGVPQEVAPGVAQDFDVHIFESSGAILDPFSTQLVVSINASAPQSFPLVPLGGNVFRATLPAADCLDSLAFHLVAHTLGGAVFTDPPGAPDDAYRALAALGINVSFQDDMEGDVSGWTVVNDPSLTSGAWQQADPNGTISLGQMAAPDDDATPGAGNAFAFVTENGPAGGAEWANDVDHGPTWLLSPVLDLSGTVATVAYARWFYCEDEGDPGEADFLVVQISNDGGASWSPVPDQTTGGTDGWKTASFVVNDIVVPTSQVRVRFGASDIGNNSVTEAGIDSFQVGQCPPSCPADLDGNGQVGVTDFLQVLAAWGPNPGHPADLDGDGAVGISDFLALLAQWGPC